MNDNGVGVLLKRGDVFYLFTGIATDDQVYLIELEVLNPISDATKGREIRIER